MSSEMMLRIEVDQTSKSGLSVKRAQSARAAHDPEAPRYACLRFNDRLPPNDSRNNPSAFHLPTFDKEENSR